MSLIEEGFNIPTIYKKNSSVPSDIKRIYFYTEIFFAKATEPSIMQFLKKEKSGRASMHVRKIF
jgi:hypothetical protein